MIQNQDVKKLIVTSEGAAQRLDTYLNTVLGSEGPTRSQIKNHIDNGRVLIDGNIVKAGYKLKEGSLIELEPFEEPVSQLTPENLPVDIIYEDDDIIVINKEQGMVVHPGSGNKTGTLVNALLFSTKIDGGEDLRPGIVHRIDKNTSGLLVIAKNVKSHEILSRQIKERTVKREYLAVCHGVFKNISDTLETQIGRHSKDRTKMAVVKAPAGKAAVTHYTVLKQGTKFALVHFRLETGRTHQIRVHAAHIGHVVAGDDVYGSSVKPKGSLGQLLHAHILSFTHPSTGKQLSFKTNSPKYFEDFCAVHI